MACIDAIDRVSAKIIIAIGTPSDDGYFTGVDAFERLLNSESVGGILGSLRDANHFAFENHLSPLETFLLRQGDAVACETDFDSAKHQEENGRWYCEAVQMISHALELITESKP